MTNPQALAIIKLAAELVEGARKAFPDLQEDTEACRLAVELRSLLDPLRICSECGQASGNVTDICAGCWDSYSERMRREDEDDGFDEVDLDAIPDLTDEERARYDAAFGRDEDDGPNTCLDCGVELPSYYGGLCDDCQRQRDEDARAAAYDPDLDEQRDRDWEGEALALREAELDAAVSPFDEA